MCRQEQCKFILVLHISNLYGIHLRTGCFCNPGACQRHLKLTPQDIKHHFALGHVCGDQNDLIDGYPTGSVRISFGYMSTKKDVDTFLNMIEECFVTKPVMKKLPLTWQIIQEKSLTKFNTWFSANGDTTFRKQLSTTTTECSTPLIKCDINSNNTNYIGTLQQMFIYPIKSCAAFSINKCWELTNTGFKYDRQWMIVNARGVCITQKHDTRLCLIKPEIDVHQGMLKLFYEDLSTMLVPLNAAVDDINNLWPLKCQSKVCGDRIQGWDCGNDVANWLSEALGLPGLRLLRQCSNANEISRSSKHGQKQLSLTNQAQFLLINTASVQWLLECIPKNGINESLQDLICRFRPNFVVNFKEQFVENLCSGIQIGDLLFKCDGQCTRCQMICVNQSTGEKSVEPLKTLSAELNGKISFGIYLTNTTTKPESKISIDSRVIAILDTKID